METRPRIKIPLGTADKIAEAGGWCILLLLWAVVLMHYGKLPQTIPVHYNASGTADGYSSRSAILSLPVTASLLYIGMTILNRFPHIFNYLREVNAGNARVQYTQATRMIRYLKLMVAVVFLAVGLYALYTAGGNNARWGSLLLPGCLLMIFLPLLVFVLRSAGKRKEKAGAGRES